jgi:hypothetical protein
MLLPQVELPAGLLVAVPSIVAATITSSCILSMQVVTQNGQQSYLGDIPFCLQ